MNSDNPQPNVASGLPSCHSHFPAELTTIIREGLTALGIERLTLTVHDSSFPSTPDEDIGRGSPYGRGARNLVALAASLGFDSIQLGPQGDTSLANPSPYDGARYTKSPLLIALATLAENAAWAPLCRGLLEPLVAARTASPRERTQYSHAWIASHRTLENLYARFRSENSKIRSICSRFSAFRARWQRLLHCDGLYEALSREHGTDDWRSWPAAADRDLLCPTGDASARRAMARRAAIESTRADDIERHLFGQFVLDEQHRALRTVAASHAIALLGDLQIGYSHRDVWSQRQLFCSDYLMGAPPSSTNPKGQSWGYPVIDRTCAPERILVPLLARIDRLLADFDGFRIDHPHGLVCPWVYLKSDPDPETAVSRGARLLCSPNLPDHPSLAALAIPFPEQISGDARTPRYADDWVRDLREDQVDRYGLIFDAIVDRFHAAGRHEKDLICEVLSTWPYPLRRVMQRHGMGRFRVTQKADLTRPDNVYRSENASPCDWVMVGNHDTPPVWLLVQSWHGTAIGLERVLALAKRLCPDSRMQPRLVHWIAADSLNLAQAMLAELFVGPARRISMFFPDWLGMREIYNRPGEIHPDNWMLRIPVTFAEDYRQRVARGAAFNPLLSLALALSARRSLGATTRDDSLPCRLVEGARMLMPKLDPELVSFVQESMTRTP